MANTDDSLDTPIQHRQQTSRTVVHPSNASVVETEINFEDDIRQPSEWEAYHNATELQPYRRAVRRVRGSLDADARLDSQRLTRDDYFSILARQGFGLRYDVEHSRGSIENEVYRDRQMLHSEGYDEEHDAQIDARVDAQNYAWRLHELRRMQTRMARAGFY